MASNPDGASGARLLSRRDLEFLLYEWLDVGKLCTRGRYREHGRETFDAALDLAERLAAEQFQPINRLLDEDEPRFDGKTVTTPAPLKRALSALAATGLLAAAQDEQLGGMQLPIVVEKAAYAYLNAASVGASAYPFLTIANCNLLLAHADPAIIDTWVRPMLEGRYFGTMCLSEPQAGSSLSDIRTRAVRQPDGSFRLHGNKMWISGGDHDLSENIVHLVLAKIEQPDGTLLPGVRGISLFLAPKFLPDGERNDIALAGLNHKMGFRGTTNCLLNFGEGAWQPRGRAGAVGWLVGEQGRGLAAMFHMMNEARIGVGLLAVALGYAGYLHSLDYARQRPQGRRPQAKDPAGPQLPIIEHADVRRMLLAQKSYVEGGLALGLYCARLVDEERTADDDDEPANAVDMPSQAATAKRRRARDLLDLLTPIVKSWPAQWCLEANNLAIQVLGGYGYTRDYPVEQFYRDNRLNPIHEGTHGIQAIDLLGRKAMQDDGRLMKTLAQEIGATLARASSLGGETRAAAQRLQVYGARISGVLEKLATCDDLDRRLANASLFLEALGHYVVAWIWLEQMIVAQSMLRPNPGAQRRELTAADQAFYHGKRQAARYFLDWELPRIGPMLLLLESQDATPADMDAAWF
jgi:acyl-CoA dehydrogenase